ncbi:MAG: DUF167 domain-containing protein [bacterium]
MTESQRDEKQNWRQDCYGAIRIRATPNASANKIIPQYDENNILSLKIYITCAPEDGKANKAIIKLLSKELRIPKSAITITKGVLNRDKIAEIKRY